MAATKPIPDSPTSDLPVVIPWSTIEREYHRLRVPSLDKRPRAEQAEIRREVVALFWRYEGRLTDGKKPDVVVTMSSFARHTGLPRRTLHGWLRGVGTCINTGIPPSKPREGFVRTMNTKLRQAIHAVTLVDDGTRQLIARDLVETRRLLDRLEQRLQDLQEENG